MMNGLGWRLEEELVLSHIRRMQGHRRRFNVCVENMQDTEVLVIYSARQTARAVSRRNAANRIVSERSWSLFMTRALNAKDEWGK